MGVSRPRFRKGTSLPPLARVRLRSYSGSASTLADLDEKDVKAIFWRNLIDNLNRAIDEVYWACELDEEEIECQEVIMALRAASNDFQNLIKRFRVQAEYELSKSQVVTALARFCHLPLPMRREPDGSPQGNSDLCLSTHL